MVWVSDDVFTINHKWIRDYASKMRRRGLHISFECISRADRLNAEMLVPPRRTRLLSRLDRL